MNYYYRSLSSFSPRLKALIIYCYRDRGLNMYVDSLGKYIYSDAPYGILEVSNLCIKTEWEF